ncbi:hypothetical protein N657DRAFT_693682 [Parathielavia appendiculata]|uniref:Uncharacterized protein n=1 Tax=Parathielavia appendiculata TaxID=2587402 RepID=A0AAN6TRT2_9PEZI|nr:hypothetical protein N657DRAFT_693682 [Parathielavia appendiculata]
MPHRPHDDDPCRVDLSHFGQFRDRKNKGHTFRRLSIFVGYADPELQRGNLKMIRFIDVEQMCIATLEGINLAKQKYIALSYVWGVAVQHLRLDTTTADALAKPGSMAGEALLPTTPTPSC